MKSMKHMLAMVVWSLAFLFGGRALATEPYRTLQDGLWWYYVMVDIPWKMLRLTEVIRHDRADGDLTIPSLAGNSVGYIGTNVFASCNWLTSINLESVHFIEEGAFRNCNRLTSVKMPNVFSIEASAFSGCTSLVSVVMQTSGIHEIGPSAFSGCRSLVSMTIPYSVTNIASNTFYNCSGLESVNILSGVRRIGAEAFYGCSKLASVNIPTNVLSIGTAAFKNCSGVEKLVISSGVRFIGSSAFYGCRKLESVSIPDSVTTIGERAFNGCTKLTEIKVDSANTTYSSSDGVLYNKSRTSVLSCPEGKRTAYVIPNGVTSIVDYAFSGCGGLPSLTIPKSVQSIAESAFENCKGLVIYAPPAWEGTGMLEAAEKTNGCTVLYYGQAPNAKLSIAPSAKHFGAEGGGEAILVSGSGTWTADKSVSCASWLALKEETGSAGYPVTYWVDATTNVESRQGLVLVSGHVHTVTQDGAGATISPTNAVFETDGGTGTTAVTVPAGIGWRTESHCDWLTVGPTRGTGPGNATYTVSPLCEVATRQGTLTVAGNTFTVLQYGKRMKIAPTAVTNDYMSRVISVSVEALESTEWTVEPKSSWLQVWDAGSGKGSGTLKIRVLENPSWKSRTGKVAIGTETFTVTQEGRTDLEFAITPATRTVNVNGATEEIAVTATPDLPWSAESQANWLMVAESTATGSGNGSVTYSASPNSTLYERTGKIVVTPGDTRARTMTHTVTQPAAGSALSQNGYDFGPEGGSCTVEVSLSGIVEWQIQNTNRWLTVAGATNRVGPGTVTLTASPNETVYPKNGTVMIARKAFKVQQAACGVEVSYDSKLFGRDGGSDSIAIHPVGELSWKAKSSDTTWLTIFQGEEGVGEGTVRYIVAPFTGSGLSRTGTITVGNKVIYITQRVFDLSIVPTGAQVEGKNGEGEFEVTATNGEPWSAIATVPWITLMEGHEAGTGSGTVRFLYAENDTGINRVGKIIVEGEVYTLQQQAREMITITAEAGHGGKVDGGGAYDLGTGVTLTAVPDSGYVFSHWTGAVESLENPLEVVADGPKSYTAVFSPLPVGFESVISGTNGVALAWNRLAWAVTFRIFRSETDMFTEATVLAELPNTGECSFLDGTGEVGVEYWYWVEAVGPEDDVTSDPVRGRKERPLGISPIVYENLMGAENPNPAEYEEGTALVFKCPGKVEGFTFAGWMPPQITPDMTGTQTVTAAWVDGTWTYEVSNNTAMVKSVSPAEGNLTVPSMLGGYPVTGIGGAAFYSCGNLTAVAIPDGVTDIGTHAFYGCTNLASIDLGTGLRIIGTNAFDGCRKLDSVVIPDSVVSLEGWAFQNCSGMESVVLGRGVSEIGVFVFQGCSKLSEFEVSDGNEVYGSVDGVLYSKDGRVLVIYPAAKGNAFDIPDGVTDIGSWAFRGCTGLESVSIPDSVTNIESWAFYNCRRLDDLAFGEGLARLGDHAFHGCQGLTNVSFGERVASIGEQAFLYCENLEAVHVQDLAAWCGIVFPGTEANPLYYARHLYVDGAEVTDLSIPVGAVNIGSYAFLDATGLASVTIPDSVTNIGDFAFCGCSGVTNMVIGNHVKSIGRQAFYCCSGLTGLTIPNSVKSIGQDGFSSCSGLKTLNMPTTWKTKTLEGEFWSAYTSVPARCQIVYYESEAPGATTTTPVPVEHRWLEENATELLAAYGGDYETTANAEAANGMPVWKCYLAGLSTTDEKAKFKVKSLSVADGEVKVEWEPDLNDNGTQTERRYIVEGKPMMGNDWAQTNAASRFFRVKVGLLE